MPFGNENKKFDFKIWQKKKKKEIISIFYAAYR